MNRQERRRAAKSAPPLSASDLAIALGHQLTPLRSMIGLFELTRITYATVQRSQAGEHVSIPVPCDGCTACCHGRVRVRVAEERPEDLSYLDLVPDPETPGDMFLHRRENGRCSHLGPQGCTVYEHRPSVCRVYDCRLEAMVGIRTQFTGGHMAPFWEPDMSPQEWALQRKMRNEVHRDLARRGRTARTIADAVLAAFNKVYATMRELRSIVEKPEPADDKKLRLVREATA